MRTPWTNETRKDERERAEVAKIRRKRPLVDYAVRQEVYKEQSRVIEAYDKNKREIMGGDKRYG